MNCPDKNCRSFGRGMDNIDKHSTDQVNYICHGCGCHFKGDKNNPQFFTRKEWEDWVNVVDGIDYRNKPLLE